MRRIPASYQRRNIVLRFYGYRSYAEYLNSEDWKVIKSRLLTDKTMCVMCEQPAEVLHHVRYSEAVILGLLDSRLAPLCNMCHEMIEVDQEGFKRSLGEANKSLFEWARENRTGRKWCERYYGESDLEKIYDKKQTSFNGMKNIAGVGKERLYKVR